MIVAGIGSRKGVAVRDVLAAIDAALAAHGVARAALSALATTEFKRDEAAIFAAGQELGLAVTVVGNEGPTTTSPVAAMTTLSHSALSQSLAGTPSVSETAALAAAGHGAKLLGPRVVHGPVTCALAASGDGA